MEAHARSCVYILVPTRIFLLKIFSFGRVVCSRQGESTSEDKVRVFYAIKCAHYIIIQTVMLFINNILSHFLVTNGHTHSDVFFLVFFFKIYPVV